MPRIRSLIALTFALAASASCAAEVSTRLMPADEQAIRDLEAKSWVAWKDHDAAFFEHFLSADHVEVHGYGVAGKKAVVDGVRAGCVVQSYALGPMTLKAVAADSVLVTYRAEQDTACSQAKVPSPVWATSLYVRRDRRWVNVLYQHTPASH